MNYDRENVFAKIIRRELPAEILYEDDYVLAFKDIEPVAPIHVLVVPKFEAVSFDDFITSSTSEEVAQFFEKLHFVAQSVLNLSSKGYRILMNHGESASQTVFHFHAHIISGVEMKHLV